MFSNSSSANRKPPPQVRKVVVPTEKKPRPKLVVNGAQNGEKRASSPAVRSIATAKGANSRSSSLSRVQNGARSSLQNVARASSLSTPAQALAAYNHRSASRSSSLQTPTPPPGRQVARKRKLSPAVAAFSDSSSSESEEEDVQPAKKRIRTGELEPDPQRQMRDRQGWIKEEMEGNEQWEIIHGEKLTAGNEKDFKNPFATLYATAEETPRTVVELQYPSNCPPERFELVLPRENDGYNPFEDIEESIHHICQFYFPESQAAALTHDTTGFRRRLKRARDHTDSDGYLEAICEFNTLIKTSLSDGTIATQLDSTHSLPLPLVERILNQIYVRTVSPHVQLLKHYENGTDNVYGEVLPLFAHEIFENTALKSQQVFVDLGSGVGNVVLQAALQCGCEAWGTEIMPNPSSLAAAQHAEFVARCKRWGLQVGRVHLLSSDFLTSVDINGALQRAHTILINNKAFTPPLNESLTMKFLDLREGAKIVSLKSFVPENWEIKARNEQDARNVLRVEKKYYGTRSVSWTIEGGDYFVATKDSSMMSRYFEKVSKSRRRA
jgi:[histone H3]-lysine79 N-trimethyltransferase